MKSNNHPSRKRKTLRYIEYSAIIAIIVVLVFIFVLMCFPLYADEIGHHNNYEYYETIVVDGIETKYQKYDTINANNIAYSFIKGELYEVRENFNVYRWSLDINNNYEYFFFEYTGPIRELKDGDDGGIDLSKPETLIPAGKFIELYRKVSN